MSTGLPGCQNPNGLAKFDNKKTKLYKTHFCSMSRLELCADIQSSSSSSSSSCLRGVFTITIFSVTILWLCFVSICLAQVVRNFHHFPPFLHHFIHFCKFLQAICSLAVPPSLQRKLDLPQQLSLLLHTFSHHLFDLVQAPANKLTLDLLSCAKVWKMWSLDHGFGWLRVCLYVSSLSPLIWCIYHKNTDIIIYQYQLIKCCLGLLHGVKLLGCGCHQDGKWPLLRPAVTASFPSRSGGAVAILISSWAEQK